MDFGKFLTCEFREDLLSVGGESPEAIEEIEMLSPGSSPNPNIGSFGSFGSFSQMEQIMGCIDSLELPESHNLSTEYSNEKSLSKKGIIKKAQFENSLPPKSEKKIKKVENSPFHNYQKHLNSALKKLVIVPSFEEADEAYKHAAREIWNAYVAGDVKTKKILHFVFNERNEHQIKDSELQACGLLGVYQKHGSSVISQAKGYLSKLAIDQIDEANVEGFVKTRKMKKTEGFKDYVLSFRKELLAGYIKRRAQTEQIAN